MKPWLKTLLLSVLVLLLAAGAFALMLKKEPSEPKMVLEEPYWEARTQQIALNAHRPQIRLLGQVEPDKDIHPVAKLSAEVTNINFLDGAQVEAGDIIVELDDFDARLQLAQLEADLADLDARTQLQQSQQALDEQALAVEKNQLKLLNEQLAKQKSIGTQQSIDDLNQQIQRQQFLVLQREAAIKNHPANDIQLKAARDKLELALASAKRTLENTRIAAPFNGKLAQVLVQEGDAVNPGQVLFRLYSEDAMSVKVQLPIRLLGEQQQLDGTVVEQQRSTAVSFDRSEAQLMQGQSGFNAWFKLADASQWLPGDVVYLSLSLAPKADTLQVPAMSVFQDRWIYAVDEEQRLAAVEVDVLGASGDSLIVQPKTETDDEIRLLLTRLNNPTTGMKIYEEGIDPEPIRVEEKSEEESSEENKDE